MIDRRGEGTVRITEVKGHASEDMVREGQVRALDREGKNRTDEDADFGRRRGFLMLVGISLEFVGGGIPLFGSCIDFSLLSPVLFVNNDGSAGTASDPWFGPLVPFPSGGGLCMLFAIMPC